MLNKIICFSYLKDGKDDGFVVYYVCKGVQLNIQKQ